MYAAKIILLLISLRLQTLKAVWLEPYFQNAQTTGVDFQSAVGLQKINVREELAWPFKLAKINYDGIGTPTLGAFEIGDNSLLGAKISLNDSEWLITIEKRQDYENPQQRIYAFQIYLKNEPNSDSFVEQSILLTLENIFDNKPTVTYSPSPCRVEELRENFLTNCIFSVYDADGMDRNNIRIMAGGRNNDADMVFDFIEFGDTTTYEKHFKLNIKEQLHYEERAIYNLNIKVYDANNNTGDLFAILEVIDLPNRDPIWLRPLTTATLNEKQEQFYTLEAIDGDTGINKPICYRLEFEQDYSQLMSINVTTGILHVSAIDRDTLNQQIFTFYTCAFKCDNSSWFIKNTTILIVQDINDHIPEITLVPDVVQILESKYMSLPLQTFLIEDIDLGNNGTFDVYFSTSDVIVYSNAFSLIPNSGYQHTNFSLTVAQVESLDYEDPNWRSFELLIVAREVENPTHTTNRTLKIELLNWNDEWPIFGNTVYETSVLESTGSGTFLQQVYAEDRDVNDEVLHAIVGNMSGFEVNAQTGVITTVQDNIFDYERQSVMMLQIQARDSLITRDSDMLHTSFAQLTINVIDENDETPELRLPRFVVNITENSPPSTLLTDKIEARDPDTTANLTFEIIWTASYATKSGQEADGDSFVGCFVIEPLVESINLVYGLLRTNPVLNQQVDYEKYDTIFLMIRVIDLNQELNEDSSTAVITIRVDDVNDNAPEFSPGTLNEIRKVTELEEVLTVIGTIGAFDIDGPGNNIITFSLKPIGSLTKDGLVTISNETGVLRVNDSIQCDIPKVYNLEYEIILTDTVHSTVEKIFISIIDINNRIPQVELFEQHVAIFENSTTGQIVGQIKAHDDDRDAPHNILEYSINDAVGNIHSLFKINITNGLIMVHLRDGLQLDRDNGVTYHYIAVDIKDNFNYNSAGYGPVNHRSTFLNVTLLDVNDNAPIMPAKTLFSPEFSETDLKGTSSKSELIAMDKDEPNTQNSWISYRILSIQPIRDNDDNVDGYAELFEIFGDDQVYAKLMTNKDLEGYYGWWEIEIEAFDHGMPPMHNSTQYEVYVRPHNFHVPQIIFPIPNKSIRVCSALQEPNRPLFEADCLTRLSLFEAFDTDGGEYGDIRFQLSSDVGHDKYFSITKETRNKSSLYLKQPVTADIYYLNVRATDGGGSSSGELRNLKIVFVDMLGNPMFLKSTYQTNFTENEQGLQETRYIPAAYDPKNEGLTAEDEQYKLYYFIDETMFSKDSPLFTLDKETRLLNLVQMLDRETLDMHQLRVKVTNNPDGLITNPNSVNFTLDIFIQVNDVNDNPPRFTQRFYAAGITPKDSIDKAILVVFAEDPDLDDPTTYEMDSSSLETHGEHIASNKFNFFSLDNKSGVLSLVIYVTNDMKGYFTFNVTARDTNEQPHLDTASVKIYIVAEANRVKFVFLSDIQTIRKNEKLIRDEFQLIYGYEFCNIDSIDDVTNTQQHNRLDDNNVGASITDVTVHFINNNEAVEADEIQRRSSDLAFISKLQNALQRHNLILNDVPHLSASEVTQILDNWILTALIVTCVVLAALCTILVAVFVLKMRSLRRQLKAFEPPEFGSVASNLNRLGVPTTNIFSVEGSNPVINRQSRSFKNRGAYEQNTSSDSEKEDDFAGLQEDPIFDMNTMKDYEQENPPLAVEHKKLNSDFFAKAYQSSESSETENKLRY